MDRKDLSKMSGELSQILTSLHKLKDTIATDKLYDMLENILMAMNESIIITITNIEGAFLYANDRFYKRSKYNRQDLIGQNEQMMWAKYHSEQFITRILQTIHNGEIWQGELHHIAKDGTDYWVDATLVPLFDEKGMWQHFISFQTDITEKKKMEAQVNMGFIRTFQNLQNGIFKVRKDENNKLSYILAEGKLMDAIGASAEAILSKSPTDVFEANIAKVKEKYYLEAFEGKHVQYELELNNILIYVDVEPIKQNGIVTEIVGTVHDVSEFRNVQKKLKVNEERYQSLINYSYEYIIALDKFGTVLHMNDKTMALFGIDSSIFGKMNISQTVGEKERNTIVHNFEKALNGELSLFEYEVKHNTERRFLNVTFMPTLIDNEIEGVYVIGKDITDEKMVQERNAYLAHHDELTGLANRRWMETKIHDSLKNADETHHELALLSLDLDRFKSINDTLGHFVGDELLQQIAKRLQNNLNDDQVHVARMGGDEFMVLYPNLSARADVLLLAENILQNLSEPFYVQGFELLISASIGIVFYKSSDPTVIELMKQVDVALYRAKELGRNMYQVYENSMNRENYQSFILERDLRKAEMNDEFIVYLQPRVDALQNKVVGAEALVRWNHPERGLISPAQFIPLAEESGLIISIGKWVKRKVCELLVKWRKAGQPLIPISVNISSKRFLQHGFAEEIHKLLEEFGLEGEWLEIEITENSIMRNEEIVQKTLKDLKEMGVKIFIDDFGTGYSSFNYLKTFEIDGIKIDQTFVHNIHEQSENASITTAMIKLAQQLQLEVIAEGVEKKEELDYLLSEDCHLIQGFYYSKPCPIEQFEQKYLSQK